MIDLIDLLYQCFQHFYHLDCANAPIHTAPVRYSPITFRLAEAIDNQLLVSHQPLPSPQVYSDVYTVMLDRGEYEEDKGR